MQIHTLGTESDYNQPFIYAMSGNLADQFPIKSFRSGVPAKQGMAKLKNKLTHIGQRNISNASKGLATAQGPRPMKIEQKSVEQEETRQQRSREASEIQTQSPNAGYIRLESYERNHKDSILRTEHDQPTPITPIGKSSIGNSMAKTDDFINYV